MEPKDSIESRILTIRNQRVILAADLAAVYGVQTKRLNEQVQRNAKRFPSDFEFQLTADELASFKLDRSLVTHRGRSSRSQNATLKRGQHAKYPPYAFTEHGAIMAATILNSPQAVAMSVYVVRAFVRMRENLAANAAILKRLTEIDETLLAHDGALRTLWSKLKPLLEPPAEAPRKRIGFHAELT